MKILVTGDFCPTYRALENYTNADIFGDFNHLLKEMDINITNLECPLTDSNTPIKKTGPNLKSPLVYAKLLKKVGFNMVTLANNHIMDYGFKGLQDTINILDAEKIDHIGAGRENEDISTKYITINDKTIAIINFCENEWSTDVRQNYKASAYSEIDIYYSIKKAKIKANYVILIHHGGHEMYNLPSPRLKKAFRYFVDCGADIVINHHTHCIGGYEIYNSKPIFYSLGNFIFDNPNHRNSIWNYGMSVVLNFDSDLEYKIIYFEQFNNSPSLRFIEESDLPYDIHEINNTIQDDELLEEKFKKFVLSKKKLFNSYIEPINSRYYNFFRNRGLLPSIWNNRKKHYLKNLINCESHREVLQEILREEMIDNKKNIY